ncbi:MAG: Fic family protein [Acidobacteriota bacterium]|nr:Fic family protein [Acidobacteriota bacterium]
MDPARYEETAFGRAQRTPGPHGYVAYFPRPIPRHLAVSAVNVVLLSDAEAALGRLAGAGRLLPEPQLLVGPYLRREAVASTRIEGTRASLGDIFDAEASDRPPDADVEEVINYIAAMETGLERLATLPLSTRLIREMYSTILAGVRGRERQPGELRSSQNWIGAPGDTIDTAVFVPPPASEVQPLLDDLERFVHDPPQLPVLVQAALIHYQFETIHPFLDGNGRLGRLLVVFFLVIRDRLPAPLLYLSPYFERRRTRYYDALQMVREAGDFDAWLALFLEAVATQAADAVARAERLTDLRERYRHTVRAATRGQANRLVDLAFEQPVLTAIMVERRLGVTRPAALTSLRQLEELGILRPSPVGPRRQLRWTASEVMEILTADES